MIISIVNEKGGSGKTSLAINLACKLSDKGDKVVFVDTDPQRSGELWVNIRKNEELELPFKYEREFKKDLREFDSVIIDTGGRDSKEMREAIKRADLVLIPSYASQYDLAVLHNMITLYESLAKKDSKCFIVINRAFTNPCLKNKVYEFAELVRAKIKEKENVGLLESILYDREAVRNATMRGIGISQTQNNKAKREFDSFFEELLHLCNKD